MLCVNCKRLRILYNEIRIFLNLSYQTKHLNSKGMTSGHNIWCLTRINFAMQVMFSTDGYAFPETFYLGWLIFIITANILSALLWCLNFFCLFSLACCHLKCILFFLSRNICCLLCCLDIYTWVPDSWNFDTSYLFCLR